MTEPIQITPSLLKFAQTVAEHLQVVDAEHSKDTRNIDWYAEVKIKYDGEDTGIGVVLSGDYDEYVVTIDPEMFK